MKDLYLKYKKVALIAAITTVVTNAYDITIKNETDQPLGNIAVYYVRNKLVGTVETKKVHLVGQINNIGVGEIKTIAISDNIGRLDVDYSKITRRLPIGNGHEYRDMALTIKLNPNSEKDQWGTLLDPIILEEGIH